MAPAALGLGFGPRFAPAKMWMRGLRDCHSRNQRRRCRVVFLPPNQEAIMTDYRDPNYRDPNRPIYRDSDPADAQPWSNATWGWIAGIAVVVLVLICALGTGGETVADTTAPPATTGQRNGPPPGPGGPKSQAPGMNPSTPQPAQPAPDPAAR